MSKSTPRLLIAIFVITLFMWVGRRADVGQQTVTTPTSAVPIDYDPTTVIVKFKPAFGDQLRQLQNAAEFAFPQSLSTLNTQFGVSSMLPIAPDSQDELIHSLIAWGRVDSDIPRVDHIFQLNITGDVLAAVAAFERNPFVEYAEPNFLVEAYYTPNDEFFSADHLWGMYQVGAESAWDVTQGEGVVVAVIDSGVDATHSELKANIYVNSNEIPNNGIDDDKNGYIDDVSGWDFADNDNLPDDPNGHGTHVAGTIAAVGDNQHGVVGLAPKAQILPVRALGATGGGQSDDLQKALIYAADSGADIINNSWGGRRYSQAFADAIDYAHERGVLVISAAGNSSGEEACEHTPANVETGMAVSSFANNGRRSGFSNRGVKIDVGAPGGNNSASTPADGILSTGSNQVNWEKSGREFITGGDGEKYLVFNGTSMATPHVSGLAALIKSQHPDWSPEQIRQVIRQSADDLGSPGFDTDSGHGLISAAEAVNFGNVAPAVALITEPRNCVESEGSIDIVGSASADDLDFYELQVAPGEQPGEHEFATIALAQAAVEDDILATWDTANVPNGTYTLRLLTHDKAGNVSEDRNLVTMTNVVISSPSAGQAIRGKTATITGAVPQPAGTNAAKLQSYALEYAAGANATDNFTLIHESTEAATGDLAKWDVSGLDKGQYTLRLTAKYDRHDSVAVINVTVGTGSSYSVSTDGWMPSLGDAACGVFNRPLLALPEIVSWIRPVNWFCQ